METIVENDPHLSDQLLPLVYHELRRLATQKLSQETADQTLQPTALVHEAYLRLVGQAADDQWDNRGHFFAAAAEAMRRILVERARHKASQKHGGDWQRVEFDESLLAAADPREDILALDKALDRLTAADQQAAALVKLRYFVGLTLPEIAQVLEVSPRTADRLWAFARAWLHQELEGNG